VKQCLKAQRKRCNPSRKNPEKPNEAEFFRSIAELIRSARHHLEKQVNTTMVVTYFENRTADCRERAPGGKMRSVRKEGFAGTFRLPGCDIRQRLVAPLSQADAEVLLDLCRPDNW